MVTPRRDSALIDALEAIEPVAFTGSVWRLVRDGRDPLQCSASGGRWDDGTFDVLYTSMTSPGAKQELRFQLMRGQPAMASKIKYRMYEMKLSLSSALQLLDLDALSRVALKVETFGRLSYERKGEDYPRTQEIAEVAHFLDFDGLIVPSARSEAKNVVVLCDRNGGLKDSVVADLGLVNLD